MDTRAQRTVNSEQQCPIYSKYIAVNAVQSIAVQCSDDKFFNVKYGTDRTQNTKTNSSPRLIIFLQSQSSLQLYSTSTRGRLQLSSGNRILPCIAVQCSAVQCSAVQCSAVQCSQMVQTSDQLTCTALSCRLNLLYHKCGLCTQKVQHPISTNVLVNFLNIQQTQQSQGLLYKR